MTAQAEEQRLASATRVKGLEAELASTRQQLAESERELRKGRAQWGGDLEARSAEVRCIHSKRHACLYIDIVVHAVSCTGASQRCAAYMSRDIHV